jgi:hypothetical protein
METNVKVANLKPVYTSIQMTVQDSNTDPVVVNVSLL